MIRRTPVLSRCLGAALSGCLVAASLLVAVPAGAKVPRAPHRYSASIEPLAGYSSQTKCSPWAKPGTTAFANLLLRTYRNSRSLGIVRACGVGGQSEHKEGRAFDWGVSAYSKRDRASVNAVMRWLLKPDRYGNRFAMARRLGIQYMIWNRRIWGSYAASSGWRPYTGASPHTDHVHFSLSWKGARKQTSFWKPRSGGSSPEPEPEPKPRPRPEPRPRPRPEPRPKRQPQPKPQPGRKALPEPSAARALRPGPTLADETLQLPVRRRFGATTDGALQAGHRYLLEVSGTYRYGRPARSVADAECAAARGSGWGRDRSVRRRSDADHLDVYVDGHDLQAEADDGEQCDLGSHTYRWVYEPERDGRVPLRVWDPTSHADNSGHLDVRIVDTTPRDRMTWRVPARAAAGATSPGSLRAGVEYEVTVDGTWRNGRGLTSDAECSRTTADATWLRSRDGDHDVLLDRSDERFEPLVDTGDACNTEGHAYTYRYTPGDTRPVNLRVDDQQGYGDNRGSLRVRVRPYVEPEPEPIETETVEVDSAEATPVRTAQSYPAGTELRLTVTGTYRWSDRVNADAECAEVFYRDRWYDWDNYLRGDGDVTVDGVAATWRPRDGSGECDRDHTYYRDVRVDEDGPVSFVVADDDHADNEGSLTVTVEER